MRSILRRLNVFVTGVIKTMHPPYIISKYSVLCFSYHSFVYVSPQMEHKHVSLF